MTQVSAGAIKGLDLAEAGSAEVLKIADLNVDDAYQRDLRHDLVNKIAEAYDIVKAGPVLISERADGSLWVVDGQHRIAGAALAGETEIFAHVVHGLTRETEAELRLARNERRGDTMAEKWRSRLVMGDPKAHAITNLVFQHGTQINIVPVTYQGINAIATLELIWDLDNSGVWLGRVLNVIEAAWVDPEDPESIINPQMASTVNLKAIAWFLSQHVDSREADVHEFEDRLRSAGPEDIRRKAVSHKAANGGAMWLNAYRAMVESYNFRRTDARKLKWKTIGSISQLGQEGTRKSVYSERGDS